MTNPLPDKPRCAWAGSDPLYIHYHDHEWGVAVHDDRRLFEMLSLEGAQAGLSWINVLRRRDDYRTVFDGFDPHIVAAYDEAKIASLMQDTRIIRNQRKIRSVISNARTFLGVQAAFGSFDTYLWQFVDGSPINNCFETRMEVPAKTPISDVMSRDLKKRGFSFVGSTICYAYMQGCGLVNDHVASCFLYPCAAEPSTTDSLHT